jgi:hypothetical protein
MIFYTVPFQKSHTIRNASVPLLLQNGIGRFFYASGYGFSSVFIGDAIDISHSDLISLPLSSTSGLELISHGAKYTRVEKTLKVAKYSISYENHNVCSKGDGTNNCSMCSKCLRTLLTLDIAGLINHYDNIFDIKIYRKKRINNMSRVLISKDPLLTEIVDFA